MVTSSRSSSASGLALAYVALLITGTTSGSVVAGDGVPVNSITTKRTPPIPSGPYLIDGDTITYGVGDNVRIVSANVGGLSLTRSAVSKPQIAINRKDNANVQGERLTFFYPGLARGSNINIEGDEAASMEIAMNDDFITSGGLDVFLNVNRGVEEANNIERIDFVVTSGITLPATQSLLGEVGTIANEKHGNNTYKIALITAIDAAGQPSAYGPLKLVEGNADYGNVGRPQNSSGTNLRNLYLRNGPTPVGGNNGPVAYIRGDTNFIGLSFVSFAALEASPGQIVFGYSLFPNDMFDSNDLVNLTDAPLNTNGSVNGGDIYGGTFAIFTTPAAEAETNEGPATAELVVTKTVSTFSRSSTTEHSIPGNDVLYQIVVANTGAGVPDTGSVLLIDDLPPELTFFNGDVDDSGPATQAVSFTDAGSNLSWNFASDVAYSNGTTAPTTFLGCNYAPAVGYDPAVTFICIRPSGTMAAGPLGSAFTLSYRARVN